VVDAWLEALEQKDAEKALSLFADDVILQAESMEQPITGKQPIQPMFASFLDACESIRLEREKMLVSDREAAVLAKARVKLRSDLEIMGEKLPTAGKELRVWAALFFVVNEQGQITELTRVRDSWEIMRQLGIPPERVQSLVRKLERKPS
jgi:steroid delta-isomerase-like uncharacterized protein